MQICITGMHRSGTSMIARMLNLSGVYMGKSQDMMPAAADNPNGFWENLQFRQLNDDLLTLAGAAWDVPYINASLGLGNEELTSRAQSLINELSIRPVWGWKDPRNSLTLPFWRKLIPEARLVVCLRHPAAVARSLSHRGLSSFLFGLQLWEQYNNALAQNSTQSERIVIHYDSILENPEAELRRLANRLALDISQEAALAAVHSVQIQHRHQTRDNEIALPSSINDLYLELLGESSDSTHSASYQISGQIPLTAHPNEAATDDKTIRQLQGALASQIATREELEVARHALIAEIEDKIQHIAILTADLAEMTTQRDRGIAQLRIYEDTMVSLKQKLQLSEENVASAEAALLSARQILEDGPSGANEKIPRGVFHENELEALRISAQSLVAARNSLAQDLEEARKHAKEAASIYDDEIARLNDKVGEQSAENALLKENLSYASQSLELRSDFIEALKEQMIGIIDESNLARAELKTEINIRQSALDSLNKTAIVKLGKRYWSWRARFDGTGALAGTSSHYLVSALDGKLQRTAKPAPQNPPPAEATPLILTNSQQLALEHILKTEGQNASVEDALRSLSNALNVNRRPAFASALDVISNQQQKKPLVRDALSLPPITPAPAKRLRMLFITGEFPNHIHGGGGRFADFIKALGRQHDIYLLTWYHENEDAAMLAELRPYCASIVTLSSKEFEMAPAGVAFSLIGRHPVDVVHYAWPRGLKWYDQTLAKRHIFTHVESTSLRSMIELRQISPDSKSWGAALARFADDLTTEIYDAAPMDARIVVTPSDGEFMASLDHGDNYVVIPTTINLSEFESPEVEPHPLSMTFIGNFKHYPNEDAAHWFFKEVFPRVKLAAPEARVYIVGASPSQGVMAYNDDRNIFVTGTVADVRPYIQLSSFCIAPLINGAGIRGKVNQYAALRRTSVVTSIAAKDLPYVSGDSIFISDNPEEFANNIIALLRAPALAREMGLRAKNVAQSRYDLSVAVDGLNRLHSSLGL